MKLLRASRAFSFSTKISEGVYRPLSKPLPPAKTKKAEPLLDAAFVNRDQILGGGCNLRIADMQKYHNFWEGFKSVDMLEIPESFAVVQNY